MSTRVHSDVFFTNFTHFAIAITASKDMVLKTKSSPFELSFDLIRRFLTFSNVHRMNVFDNNHYIFVFSESQRVLFLQATKLEFGCC